MILDGLAWIVLLLVALSWVWALILWRIDRKSPGIVALHSAARVQEWGALLGTFVALMAASRLHLAGFTLPVEWAAAAVLVVLVGVNVPGVVGLAMYLMGKYRDG